MRILVTGGVRSGKSAHAEALLAGEPAVTYVAPGPVPDGSDLDWAARIEAHRARRPDHWTTLETADLAVVPPDGAVLVDCLGTWLTAVMDEIDGWQGAQEAWQPELDKRLLVGVEAVQRNTSVVLVTNEVGMGVVPAHASGRLFRDLLGTVNQRFAAVCDEVHLVVAGRVLRL